MALTKSTNITVNGRSSITVDGKDVVVMTMNANFNEDGKSFNINKIVQDMSLYQKNKETCATDYEEFEAYAESLAQPESE